MYVCMYVCIYIYICICIYSYTLRGCIPRAHFDNFGWGFVTVFQIMTGENWNTIMRPSALSTYLSLSLFPYIIIMIIIYIHIYTYIIHIYGCSEIARYAAMRSGGCSPEGGPESERHGRDSTFALCSTPSGLVLSPFLFFFLYTTSILYWLHRASCAALAWRNKYHESASLSFC